MNRLILFNSVLIFSQFLNAQGFKLAFGSCIHQDKPLELLSDISGKNPDIFVFLGDNVYADSYDTMAINKAYQELACNANFQKLKGSTKLLATWDDHDYGYDDIGKYYSLKESSKRLFTSFFNIANDDPMRFREGIYQSKIYRKNGKKIQIILLDNRSFRSDLTKYQEEVHGIDSIYFYNRIYFPTVSTDSTMLGEAQWKWLSNEIKRKSSLTIIASSTQFAASYNGYESWANMPNEQNKMLNIIKESKKKNVVFISGDVHYAELSVRNDLGFPIYDLTSSGISESWLFSTPNSNRIAGTIMENNYGMLQYYPWKQKIVFEIYDAQGVRIQKNYTFESLH